MTLSKNFFLLAAAFVAMLVFAGAAAFALSLDEPEPLSQIVLGISGSLAALILWRQALRDLDAVLTLVGVEGLLVGIFLGIYLVVAPEAGLAPKAGLAAVVVLSLACGVSTYRRQRSASSDFPNGLAANFPANQIFETEGIQFAGTLHPGNDGRPHVISVILQNCFDAPTRVMLQFDPAGSEKYLRYHPQHSVTVGAAEILRVLLPVVTPTYPGTYPLYYSIQVSRSAGKRVRLWRAQDATTRTKAATTIALAAFGHLHWGGGIRFILGPLPDDLWSQPLRTPIEEILWQPRLGTVPRVPPSV